MCYRCYLKFLYIVILVHRLGHKVKILSGYKNSVGQKLYDKKHTDVQISYVQENL